MMRPYASDYPRTASFAISQDVPSALQRLMVPQVHAHPGTSGFRFLDQAPESLALRFALIQMVQQTLDLQYYTMNDDVTANLLLEAILRAAARGVRVRFLIDNISMRNVGKSLAVLNGHRNIEIRVFNPPVTRDQPFWSRIAGFATDLDRMMRRMHNKLLIADNQMAILGGRNLGDEYFDANEAVSFKDADMLSAGPIVQSISRSFDQYWNDENAFPIAAVIATPTRLARKLKRMQRKLHARWEKEAHTRDGHKLLMPEIVAQLQPGKLQLLWAPAELASDRPEKINPQQGEKTQSRTLTLMESLLEKATQEFLVVSPYFVPRQQGVAWLAGMIKRGLRVCVLTNSLASTDVVAVHTGYSRYRPAVIDSGVELYELKPIGGKRPRQRLFGSTAPAHASLHAKVYVIDRTHVVVGSFNFDPRSIALNTELAVFVHSPELAADVLRMFEEASAASSSYRVLRDDRGRLTWVTTVKKHLRYWHREPKAGLWRRIEAFLFGLLPLENQL